MACIRFCLVKSASHTALETKMVIRIKSVFPTKGQTCYQHMIVPFTKKEILPTLTRFLARIVRLTISVPPLEIVFRRAKNPLTPITTPPKRELIMGLSQGVATGKLDIKGTFIDLVIKVKTELMAPI